LATLSRLASTSVVVPHPQKGFEQDVVGCLAVEGRIEIDAVDALVIDLIAEYLQVVAVVELVLLLVRHVLSRLPFHRPLLRTRSPLKNRASPGCSKMSRC
jgi:hypothetical protein